MNSSPEKDEACVSCEFQDNLAVLREVQFFGGVSLDCLKVLAIMADREMFKPGDTLLRQGEDEGRAVYIMSGKARIFRVEDGREEELTEFGPGDFVGGLNLLSRTDSLFTLRAEETVTGLLITRDKFESAISQFPDQIPRLLRNLVAAISRWEEKMLATRSPQCPACREHLGVSLL